MASLTAERSAAAGGVILVARFAAASVLNYGFGVGLAWLLIPSAYGSVSALQNLLLLAAGVLTAGLPWALATNLAAGGLVAGGPRAEAAHREFRTALVGNLALSAVFVLALLGSALAGVPVLHAGPAVLVVVALTVPVIGFNAVLAGALQGMGRFGGLGTMQSGEIAVKVVAALLLVTVAHAGVLGVAVGFAVGSLAATAVGLAGLRDVLPRPGALAGLRAFRVAAPMWVGTASFTVLLTADVLALSVLGRRTGVAAATIAAYQVCTVLGRAPYYVTDALVDAVFPSMARATTRADSHAWFVAALRWVPLAIVPIQFALVLAPGVVLRLFFPASYAAARPLLVLVTIGTLGLLLTNMVVKGLYAVRATTAVARWMPSAVVVELVGLVLAIPVFGAEGAALAYTVAAWTGLAAVGRVYVRVQRTHLLPWSRTGRYAAALTPGAVLIALANQVPEFPALLLVAAGLVVSAVAMVVAGLTRPSDMDRARHLLGPLARVAPAAPVARTARTRVAPSLEAPSRAGAVALLVVALAAVASMFSNLLRAPDTVYDEVVYGQLARNILTDGQVTWTGQPMFVHPPLSFLAQAGWSLLTGGPHATLARDLEFARVLSAAFGVLAVLVVALLVRAVTEGAAPRRRAVLVGLAGVVAALDPVLLRFSRLAMIESLAVLLGLAAVLAGWHLRRRRAAVHVAAVGLLTGLALLTKEVTVSLLVVPVVFALLRRDGRLLARAAGAFAAGVGLWLAFPAWAWRLGQFGDFVTVQTATLQRLVGLVQINGWNRPGSSLTASLRDSAARYSTSYLLLAAGGVALVWLWTRRGPAGADLLKAWLTCSYAFMVYIVAVGTLNEQFFAYIVPAAVAGTVLGADAVLTRVRHGLRTRPGRAPAPESEPVRPRRSGWTGVAVVVAVAFPALSALTWVREYAQPSRAVQTVSAQLVASYPPCTVVNSSADTERFAFLAGDARVFTDYAVGAAALSHGVHLFLLSPTDARQRLGNAGPELADWIRANGRELSSVPSRTYGSLQVWQVTAARTDPVADLETSPGGWLVLTQGSRCGGLPVTDTATGGFATGWTGVGGKALLGMPLTRETTSATVVAGTAGVGASGAGLAGVSAVQVFDGAVLGAPAGDPTSGGTGTAAARTTAARVLPVVAALAARDPDGYRAAGLPDPLTTAAGGPVRTDWLTDPAIRSTWLAGAANTAAARTAAAARYGVPLGPPTTTGGVVSQPFAGVVLTRPAAGGTVTAAAAVGPLALRSGLVTVPAAARQTVRPPSIAPSSGPVRRADVGPFLSSFAVALLLFAAVAAAVLLSRRRRAAVTHGPDAPGRLDAPARLDPTGSSGAALGTGRPLRLRTRLGLVVLVVAVGGALLGARTALREPSDLPPLPGAARPGPGLMTGARPAGSDLPTLQQSYGVTAIVDLGATSIEEQAVAAELALPRLAVPVTGDCPDAAGLARAAAFVAAHSGDGGTVYVHDDDGGSGPAACTGAALALARATDPAERTRADAAVGRLDAGQRAELTRLRDGGTDTRDATATPGATATTDQGGSSAQR